MTTNRQQPRSLQAIVRSYVRQNLLEDRSEYSTKDFQKAHGLNQDEANNLKWLVEQEMTRPSPKNMAEVETNLNKVDSHILGECLKEYIQESNHNGWDAWPSRDKSGAKALLIDLLTYIENR
jgi:hypothetical protein